MDSEMIKEYPFLKGGGELGLLTRQYDWTTTPLGSPATWDQSLRLTVSMILKSKFPMFLWWGEDLIQFYNDAYRPSFGNEGKHPLALGQKGKDCWPEIWPIIEPLIRQVLNTGEATWAEDQLIPIYRNGKLEDVYWTFGYSPIEDESGHIKGVLVICTETTEKIKVQKWLEESEQRFRTMTENTDVLSATCDETGKANYFNRAWTDFTGRPMAELLDFGWTEFIHDEDRQEFLATYLDAHNRQAPWNGQFRMLGKHGEYRWLMATGSVRHTADGSFAGYISSSIDITEQINALKRMGDSNQQIRSLIEAAPFPIGVYQGREMRVAFANKSIMDIWGKGTDVVGKLFSEVLPELDNQEVFQQLDEVYRSGIALHIKNQPLDLVVEGKAQTFYFNYSLTPLFNEEGQVYGVMNTGVDLTELNMAKRKIEESENNLRNTILQAPVAMCIFRGPDFIVDIANDRMFELWGRPGSEVLHKPIFEGLPEAKEQGFEGLLKGVYTTGKTVSAEAVPVNLPRKDRIETIYVNFVYEAYREADGTISGILAVAVDVTPQAMARMKIEEVVAERTKELAEANSNLQRSNAELAQFAYIASHDLQEPLRKIGSFSQMLEKSLGDQINEQAKNYFTKIRTSAGRMHALIRDVLAYSEVSKDNTLFERVDLNAVLENTKADYDLLLEQTDATIGSDVLPVLEAIPLQMAQLFGNLIGNALKFIKKDIKPVITLSVSELSAAEKQAFALPEAPVFYRIRFADNGIGFREAYAEQIFHIFQRLHRKADYEGTGIGLAMCKKIALNHHGTINAQGSSEHGAVFNVILPAQQPGSV